MNPSSDKTISAAVKHYESLKRAQKKYYEKKAGPKEERRPRGRPRKVAEPPSEEDSSKRV